MSETTKKKFIGYKNLVTYDTKIKKHIQDEIDDVATDAKSYTDNAVSQKSQVQIFTWEDDD